jgi:DNA-binding transcriptional LysR family regulator
VALSFGRMELRQLTYFIAVAEQLSVAQAAQQLGLEPSPLSRAMRALEADVGQALFQRVGKSTRLTAAGQTLLSHACQIHQTLEQCRARIANLSEGPAPLTRIHVPAGLVDTQLIAWLHEATQSQGPASLQWCDAEVPQPASLIKAGELDLAVAAEPTADPCLESARIGTRRLMRVLPSMIPHGSARRARLDSKATYLCLPEIERALTARRGHLALKAAASLNLLAELVAAGRTQGLALRSQWPFFQRKEIRTAPLARPLSRLSLYVWKRRGEPLPLYDQILRVARERRRGVHAEDPMSALETAI